MKLTESHLSDALEKVDCLEEENKHLRQSLEEVTEECDQQALKADDMNERLGNLAASLASMMDRQELLLQNDNEKNAQLMEASIARREHLTKLFEMEQQFMETVMGPHEGGVSLFDEQMQEMDAISADIEAMRA
jgi:chromosome segregation ATPase